MKHHKILRKSSGNMKNRIVTNSVRNIKKSFPRFLSLFLMSMLGVFVFTGLKSTAPDMLKTLDHYLDQANRYDLKIVSSQGLTFDDLEALKEVKGVKEAEGSYSQDVLVPMGNDQYVINVSSMPQTINQLTLLEGAFPQNEDEIVVEENVLKKNGLSLYDSLTLSSSSLKKQTFTIVGTVDSPLYFNYTGTGQNRGTTSIGAGTIHFYSYILPSSFSMDYYSSIYVTIENAKEELTSKAPYIHLIESAISEIELIIEEREEIRYQQIYEEMEQKIDEKEQEGIALLTENRNQLDQIKAALEQAKEQWNQTLTENHVTEDALPTMIDQGKAQIVDMKNQLGTLDPHSDAYQQLSLQIENAEKQLAVLLQLQTMGNELKAQEENYRLKEEEYTASKDQFEEEIKQARNDLKQLKKGKWYVYDRSDDATYSDYIDDTASIHNLAKIFPFIFYAVAVLVSLISMNRMVEDDRLEIGTLKSLGFSNGYILFKYLLFAFLATLCGGIVGSACGSVVIPSLIFSIYRILFELPYFHMSLILGPTLLGFFLSFICVCGTTIFTVMMVLREKPSELMRHKAPKNGKRVIIEKMPFLWKRMSFSQKVTTRNLFRYKKRVSVTIFGIAGCTALMLCGFGLKNAISNIPEKQYGEVFTFDAMAYLHCDDKDKIDALFADERIESMTKVESINATSESQELSMFICDKDQVSDIVNFVDMNNQPLTLESNRVIITEKLASLEKLKVGDMISFVDVNHEAYAYEISGICKNYINHYVFLDSGTFEASGQNFLPNVAFFSTGPLNDDQREALSASLLTQAEIISVSFVEVLIRQVDDMLRSLNKVVIILIVLAALLSFVVLYNLSNINIQERKREIATLKVLGFYDQEVDHYITKENIILTIIGIAIGLFAGYFLTHLVIATVEIERARFIRQIFFTSYLFSAIIASIFTLIVNGVTHFNLKKINMIESLKSVE